jgi:hypothetical protein
MDEMSILGVVRTEPSPGRGGAHYSTFGTPRTAMAYEQFLESTFLIYGVNEKTVPRFEGPAAKGRPIERPAATHHNTCGGGPVAAAREEVKHRFGPRVAASAKWC